MILITFSKFYAQNPKQTFFGVKFFIIHCFSWNCETRFKNFGNITYSKICGKTLNKIKTFLRKNGKFPNSFQKYSKICNIATIAIFCSSVIIFVPRDNFLNSCGFSRSFQERMSTFASIQNSNFKLFSWNVLNNFKKSSK